MEEVCFVLSVCCPHFENKRELFCALADRLGTRGVKTSVVLAGNAACSHIIRLKGDAGACAFWFDALRGRLTAEGTAFETEVVGAREDLETTLEYAWADVSRAAGPARVWSGYRLDVICKPSVVRRLRGETPQRGAAESEALTNEFQKDTLRHLIYYRELLHRRRPRLAVYFGGHFHQDRPAFLACRELGIPSIALESSFVPDRIYWDEDGVSGSRGALSHAALLHEAESLHLTAAQREEVRALMARSLDLGPAGGRPGLPHGAALRSRLGIRPGERLALFLAQVPYDASLVVDGCDFADQVLVVTALVRELQSSRIGRLVARRHPKARATTGDDVLVDACNQLGVVLDETVDATLAESLSAADFAVTVNSQSGLQAAWAGLPTIVLGRAFFGGKGFTIDAGGRRELLGECLQLANRELPGVRVDLVEAYLWTLLRYMPDPTDVDALIDRILARLGHIP